MYGVSRNGSTWLSKQNYIFWLMPLKQCFWYTKVGFIRASFSFLLQCTTFYRNVTWKIWSSESGWRCGGGGALFGKSLSRKLGLWSRKHCESCCGRVELFPFNLKGEKKNSFEHVLRGLHFPVFCLYGDFFTDSTMVNNPFSTPPLFGEYAWFFFVQPPNKQIEVSGENYWQDVEPWVTQGTTNSWRGNSPVTWTPRNQRQKTIKSQSHETSTQS